MDNTWENTRDALDSKQNKVGTDTVSMYDYSVNAIGQRDSVTATSTVGTFATAPSWNWLYNTRGEMVSSEHLNTGGSSRHYTFDGIGNRTEHRDGTHTASGGTAKAYTPNAVNQYDAVGSLNPVYDLDGNMTSGPLPIAPGANSALVWDGNHQLIEVTPAGGAATKYHYDARGRRIARTVGSTRTYWFYDGWNVVAEFSGAEHTGGAAPGVTLEKTWLWGTDLSGTLQGAGGVGGLLAANLETGANTGVYHPLYDGNGNIGQYLNSAAPSVVVAKYEYDGFGSTLFSGGLLANDFPHRFSTKPMDAETGLYYYGYRYYDPVTGRWPSRDPIEERGGLSLYAMVINDPANWIDVLGLKAGKGDSGGGGSGGGSGSNSQNCPCPGKKPKEEDDFGKKCCEVDMDTISLKTKPTKFGITGLKDFGHAAIKTPNQTAGLWPKNEASKEDMNDEGFIADDSKEKFTGGKDYRACPDSVKAVDDWINDQRDQINNKGKNPFGGKPNETYQGLNGKNGRNCMGWACEGIQQGGGKPPKSPTASPLPVPNL